MAKLEIYDETGRVILSNQFPTFSYIGKEEVGEIYDPSRIPIGLFTDSELLAVTVEENRIFNYRFKDTTLLDVPETNTPQLVLYHPDTGKPTFMIAYPPLNILDMFTVTEDNYKQTNIVIPSGKRYGIISLERSISMTTSNAWQPPGPPNWDEYYEVTEIREYLFPVFSKNKVGFSIKGEIDKYESVDPVQPKYEYLRHELLLVDLTGLN